MLSLSCGSRVPLLRGVIHKVVCKGVIQMDLNVLFSQKIGTFPFSLQLCLLVDKARWRAGKMQEKEGT